MKKTFNSLITNTKNFSSMIKLSHTVFALPFALVALLLIYQNGKITITWLKVLWVILAFTGARSFSMAINRLADARIDAKNPRTASREIPAGKLSLGSVAFFAVLSLALTSFSAWMLSPIAFYLSFPAALLLAGYSYSKRFTFLCHYWLGAVIGMAPLGVYIAVSQNLPATAWVLFFILFTYIAGFDILYSIQDHQFDQNEKLHSLPADLGVQTSLWVSLFTHLLTIGGLFALYRLANLGIIFFAGLLILSGVILGEHYVVGWGKKVQIEKIPMAFFQFNSVFSLAFLFFVLADVLL